MNNDIKEILDEMINLNDYEYYKIYGKRVNEIGQLLLDYITNLQKTQETLIKNDNEIITNLQEENKKLKELCDKYEEEHSTTFNYWKQLIKEDYKARCEKAIEYIKDNLYYCVDNDDTNLLIILKGENNDI